MWLIFLGIEIFLEIFLTCVLPWTKGYFFNLLTIKAALISGLFIYFGNLFLLDVLQNYKPYLIIRYGMIKREQLTYPFFGHDIDHNKLDNPHQRIQEDIKLAIMNSLTVYTEYMISAFIVLWMIVASRHNIILLSSALIYSAIVIIIAYIFQPRMLLTEKEVQRTEADFRTNLGPVTLYNTITANIASGSIRLWFGNFSKAQNAILTVLPFIVLFPIYMKNKMSLGDIMVIATTFQVLVVNVTVLVQMFPTLMQAKASQERLLELQEVIK